MKNIIHDLYHGKVSGFERSCVRTAEIAAIDRKIESGRRYFVEKMSLDDCQRFQEWENLFLHSSDAHQLEAFSYGVKLGASLMCAVLMDDNELPCLDDE